MSVEGEAVSPYALAWETVNPEAARVYSSLLVDGEAVSPMRLRGSGES